MNEYPVKLGVIGGSGVYEMDGAETITEHDLNTPFGKPSDKIIEVRLERVMLPFFAVSFKRP